MVPAASCLRVEPHKVVWLRRPVLLDRVPEPFESLLQRLVRSIPQARVSVRISVGAGTATSGWAANDPSLRSNTLTEKLANGNGDGSGGPT